MLKITPRKMIKCCIYMADDPYYQKTYLIISVALFEALYTIMYISKYVILLKIIIGTCLHIKINIPCHIRINHVIYHQI